MGSEVHPRYYYTYRVRFSSCLQVYTQNTFSCPALKVNKVGFGEKEKVEKENFN